MFLMGAKRRGLSLSMGGSKRGGGGGGGGGGQVPALLLPDSRIIPDTETEEALESTLKGMFKGEITAEMTAKVREYLGVNNVVSKGNPVHLHSFPPLMPCSPSLSFLH